VADSDGVGEPGSAVAEGVGDEAGAGVELRLNPGVDDGPEMGTGL